MERRAKPQGGGREKERESEEFHAPNKRMTSDGATR